MRFVSTLLFSALVLSCFQAEAGFSKNALFYNCGAVADAAQSGRANQTFNVSMEPGFGKFYLTTNVVGFASTQSSTAELTAVNPSQESPDYHLVTAGGIYVLVNYNESTANYDVRISTMKTIAAFSKAKVCTKVLK